MTSSSSTTRPRPTFRSAARWSRSPDQACGGRAPTRPAPSTKGGTIMALTKQTMTDEQRKSVAIEYLRAFDNGGVTSTGGSILDLFADDAQVYFPKWGLANGKEQIGKCFGDVGGTLKSITHHFSHFNWIFTGSDL